MAPLVSKEIEVFLGGAWTEQMGVTPFLWPTWESSGRTTVVGCVVWKGFTTKEVLRASVGGAYSICSHSILLSSGSMGGWVSFDFRLTDTCSLCFATLEDI